MSVDDLHPMRVLLAEDDPKLARLVAEYLGERGYDVMHVIDGRSAVRIAKEHVFDVLVLDVMLPGQGGLDVCRSIRADSDVPILFLTARSEETDKVVGLEIGGDDYMTKPFSPRELAARLSALVRRSRSAMVSRAPVLRVGVLALDRDRRSATRDGRMLDLTTREFELLRVLMERAGKVLRREQLVALIHGSAEDAFDRSIDVAVHRLRHKLEDADGSLLKSVRGVGYLLAREPA